VVVVLFGEKIMLVLGKYADFFAGLFPVVQVVKQGLVVIVKF
jgi:hypothetical protein